MPSEVVPRVIVTVPETAAASMLTAELGKKLGRLPSREMATLLLALAWTETGKGRVTNGNFGNITASAGYPGKIWRPTWYDLEEIEKIPELAKRQTLRALHAKMLAGEAPNAFRAYDSLDEGMRDYVAALFSYFPEVVNAAETGDPEKFVSALSERYSKDYTPAYAGTFASFQKGFGERQLFAALPKANGEAGADFSLPSPSHSPRSWPVVLERVRNHVPIIRKGSESFYVALWKYLLNGAIETNLPLDPHFDGSADEATRAFQKSKELTTDGIVGPFTWAAMLERKA